jgi:formylglycine-generating enzyme required for sulfatase activity
MTAVDPITAEPSRFSIRLPHWGWFLLAAILLAVGYVGLSSAAAEKKMEGQRAGEERKDNGLSMKLVWCPPGKFTMGSPKSEEKRGSDEDQVDVTLTKGFWLGKYEVTQQEYEKIMGKNPSSFSAQGRSKQEVTGQNTKRFPVEFVNWIDAMEFRRKLTALERKSGRLPADWEYTLPAEAEWEYACRAETTTVFSFGNQLNGKEANCWGHVPYGTSIKGAYLQRPTTVGSYSANKWGLYDMHGNVQEWCRDRYQEKLPGDYQAKLPGDIDVYAEVKGKEASIRVSRGGSWDNDAKDCRAARRDGNSPDFWYDKRGFRVALLRSSQ